MLHLCSDDTCLLIFHSSRAAVMVRRPSLHRTMYMETYDNSHADARIVE
jgi:hypothetical protein